MKYLLVLAGFGGGYLFCGLLLAHVYAPCVQVAQTYQEIDYATDVLAKVMDGDKELDQDSVRALMTHAMLLQKQGTAEAAACLGTDE